MPYNKNLVRRGKIVFFETEGNRIHLRKVSFHIAANTEENPHVLLLAYFKAVVLHHCIVIYQEERILESVNAMYSYNLFIVSTTTKNVRKNVNSANFMSTFLG